MRRRLAVALITVAATMSMATAAVAAGPCDGGDGPGNSDYAQNHIVEMAHAGNLGNGGHKPGGHQGFSKCLGVHA